ncbi:type VI secretion system tube protein TssD [Photorhabdus temperata subsp. temperata]|uniref:Type VI secretion system effector, Hcp1 family n=1 Tax=Photorhabdus temperata subsp. temperata Meg1 TaxID=1393735 RepID=A0A081S0P4_PHOTE|nr:type VI secretion system tube protein TssD [Photorhabdus temperata]KER04497.1 type VI secretion system effector, Hcp1 family [Photorhabdus temperata subsp. temperata Meg1]
MAIPLYMYIKDDGGSDIKGSVDVYGREGSIEILGLHHSVSIANDDNTGKLTGTRRHLPFMIEKEVDSSSPYLYKALTTGQTLKSTELKWYKIDAHGQEKEYFNTLMENVKVVSIIPVMLDIKDVSKEKFNHMEIVELRYEKIIWKHNDGNIIHSDSWNERA